MGDFMAYTIYFGYLPKSSLIVDRTTNIVVDNDLANLYNFEVSQISFTNNGGASFIIPLTQHKIDHMAFACFNAFFIKTMNYDDDGVYQGYSITTYDITNISYSQATNVKITGVLSPYNLALSLNYSSGGDNKYMKWTYLDGFNAYIERGYRASSIIKPATQKVNFSSKADTDLYCMPPFDIKKNIFTYSEKIKYVIANGTAHDSDINEYFKDVLWEIAFLQYPAELVKGNHSSTIWQKTGKYANNGGVVELPYFIICKPINTSIDFKFYSSADNAWHSWAGDYDKMVDAYAVNILSKQVTFLPPFKLGAGDDIKYESLADRYEVNLASTSDHGQISYIYNWDANDNPLYVAVMRIKRVPYVFNGSVSINNFKTAGMITNESTKTYSANDLADIDKNPYINLITQEIRLSDNQGKSYTYPLISLGSFNSLAFKTYVSYDLGEMWCYTTVNTSILYNSILNENFTKDYCGLLTRFNNSLLWNVDLLKEFMAQNRNFYNQREEIQYKTYAKVVKDWLISGVDIAGKNYGGAIGGLMNGISRYWDYDTRVNLENYKLDNLQEAPDKIVGQENDTLFYSNNRQLGVYIDFYQTNDMVKKALYQDFIKYGIYINRLVNDTELHDFLYVNNGSYDKLNIKYFKGSLRLKPNSFDTNNYQNNYLCADTCLKKLESMLENGCYIFKDSNGDFKPYKSDSELNIFNTYLNNNLFS